MTDTITKTHQFDSPIAKVWEAITVADKISDWFIKADFKAEKGYKYTFTHQQTIITGEVLKARPVYDLVYTWIVGNTNVQTIVSWKLEETETGTLLTLEHSGISKYPTDTAIAMFDSFKTGWSNCITNLHSYLKAN
jgi:uncharacterized protein YndB with AHSA1/START domain